MTVSPVTIPTPAELDRQAAVLREQAAGLNRRQADRSQASYADHGGRTDDAERTSAGARSAAAAATKQADELHDKAKESLGMARKLEDDAAGMAADGSVAGREMADDFREQAQLLRAGATSYTQRAQRAEEVARQQLDAADRADRQAFQTRRAGEDETDGLDQMRHAANKLEDKAVALEQAAGEMRSADRAFTSEERTEYLGKAQATLVRAEAIRPDYTRIAPQDIVAAGIPLSDVPGAELLDPLDFGPPPAAPEADLHDTDLMDPNADPVLGPGGAAGAEVNDTDLMDPNAADPSDSSDPSVDGSDTDLMDPNAELDLDGPPDPFAEQIDPGDFGLPTVADGSTPTVPGSLSEDAYMDQPDVGSSSSLDAYGDSADDTTGEYG
jgi:hypothetical protein